MNALTIDTIHAALMDGRAIPYLGPGVLGFGADGSPLPASTRHWPPS